MVPRATVCAGIWRKPLPSAKNSLERYGFSFGWSCMSWRQPATPIASSAAIARRARRRPRTSRLDIVHLHGAGAEQELARRVAVEPGVRRLDAEKVAVARRLAAEAVDVEDRVVGLRQAVERQHPDRRREGGEQD